MEWRYLAQRATTKEWLSTELNLRVEDGPGWDLSRVGTFKASLEPDVGGQDAADGRPLLEEWGTLIYPEVDGEIQGGFIVVSSRLVGARWEIECASFATYPHGIPYMGPSLSLTNQEPKALISRLWDWLQAQPDSDLGVQVTGDTATARLGTDDDPYELFWWDARDLGREITSIAGEVPLDWTEHHYWKDATKTEVVHEFRLHYPRAGRRRTDLVFTDEANIVSFDEPERGGDEFANEVVGIGAGEGQGSLRSTTAVRDGRLRRPRVHMAKDVSSRARLDAQIRDRLAASRQALTIPGITVKQHDNAPIGAWALGDDILVQLSLPWFGDIAIWHRVVGWSLLTATTAEIRLERSDAFTYGG